jgi:hypothetical protein
MKKFSDPDPGSVIKLPGSAPLLSDESLITVIKCDNLSSNIVAYVPGIYFP